MPRSSGSKWFVYRLRSLALFDLLELAGRTTVLVVAVLWVLEADNRAMSTVVEYQSLIKFQDVCK